jgi:hypothetical protein
MLQNAPVALLTTVCRWRVKEVVSVALGLRERTDEALDTQVFEEDPGGGRCLENEMALFLWEFNRSSTL